MNSEKRILIAVGMPSAPDGPPTVILGMTDESWADLEGGKAQDITLIPLGIPVQLLIMRGKDHADIQQQLREAAASLTIPEGDPADLSIPTPRTH
jgi:hypothetical protein